MAKTPPLKGVQLRGKLTYVPGAEFGPSVPNLAALTGRQPVPPPAEPAIDVDYDSIVLKPIDAESVTTNIYGATTTAIALGSMNTAISTRGIVFPGGAADENQTQWEVPVPDRMDLADPRMIVRLHILIPVIPTLAQGARSAGAGFGARAVLSKV